MLAGRDVEVEGRLAVDERQRQRGAEADVLQREDADCDRRQADRESRADPGRRDVEARTVAEEIGRDRLQGSSTNCRSPANSTGTAESSCTLTSGFCSLFAVKLKRTKLTKTDLRTPT